MTNNYEKLLKLVGQINTQKKLEDLLGTIMEGAKELTFAEASSLMLFDEGSGDLIITVPTGPARAELSGKRIPGDRGIAGWVATNGKPTLVNNVNEDERFIGDLDSGEFKTRNLIAVPLCNAEGKLIGVLETLNAQNGGFSDNDLELLNALAHQAAIAIDRERLFQKSLDAERATQELRTAKGIQAQLFPKSNPEIAGYQMFGSSTPALEVGGDYYDFIEGTGNSIYMVIGDVVGKGVPAAILMASLRAMVRSLLKIDEGLGAGISKLNALLKADLDSGQFITLFIARLDVDAHHLEYVNAGHNPPFLFDGETHEVIELTDGGPILGIMEDVEYQVGKAEFKKESRLVIFSDGLSEAQNEEGELFDEARILDYLKNHESQSASDFAKGLLGEVNSFSKRELQDDDQSLIVAYRVR